MNFIYELPTARQSLQRRGGRGRGLTRPQRGSPEPCGHREGGPKPGEAEQSGAPGFRGQAVERAAGPGGKVQAGLEGGRAARAVRGRTSGAVPAAGGGHRGLATPVRPSEDGGVGAEEAEEAAAAPGTGRRWRRHGEGGSERAEAGPGPARATATPAPPPPPPR